MSMEKEWVMESFHQREATEPHRSLEDEFAFYEAVKNGDVSFVRQNCQNNDFAAAAQASVMSADSLKNIRYHFIITTALVTRFCAEGGMVIENAYGLSDFYIKKMDKLFVVDDIVKLHHVMVLDFTSRMKALRERPEVSRVVNRTIDYIYLHLHSRIKLEELADNAGVSPGYLSKLFKKETNTTVSEYITALKIEEAQRLLRYSEMSMVDIANYLAFATQSYFVHVFHERVGMTPKKYREKAYTRQHSMMWKQDKE